MMVKQTKKLVVVGSANMDMVVLTERFPESGETVFGNRFFMMPGGKGANQAVCAAKLGGNVTFIGKMGNDLFRNKLTESMRNDGVNIDHVFIDESQSTGVALIVVDEAGNNQIVVVSGSNMKLTAEEVSREAHILSSAGVVLLQLEIPVETVHYTAHLAHANGSTVILNPAPACNLPADLFPLIDFLTPNEIEIGVLSGVPITDTGSLQLAAQELIERGVKNVIVTRGSKGAMLVNQTSVEYVDARKVEVVDTTAAGDAFNGALALGLLHQMDVQAAIEFASTVAALSVTKVGAQSSMPTLAELKRFDDSITFNLT